jgi:hypothetical protein
MIKSFFKNHILNSRALILQEVRTINKLLLLLLKLRSTWKWTTEEISQIKSHVKHLALCLAVIIIFVLPFGLLLLPLYIEFLDRREKSRIILDTR